MSDEMVQKFFRFDEFLGYEECTVHNDYDLVLYSSEDQIQPGSDPFYGQIQDHITKQLEYWNRIKDIVDNYNWHDFDEGSGLVDGRIDTGFRIVPEGEEYRCFNQHIVGVDEFAGSLRSCKMYCVMVYRELIGEQYKRKVFYKKGLKEKFLFDIYDVEEEN